RCSWGYAVTCHKAQGGEWDTVYVDMPRNITMNPTKEKYQWVYTAMTRASRSLHLVDDFFYE
ncbi:MAG: ATP-binding domain-containing protein, partial [Muribaculaceae bacterium]|nr:ATP-binding domain-containing protein [Muribaculaceae bacterium]